MSSALKPLFRHLLRFGIAGGSLWLSIRGMNVASFVSALRLVSPWSVAAATAYALFTFLPAVLRLRMISEGALPTLVSLKTFVLGAGLNNILPARIGEFAKMYYMKHARGVPLSRGMEIVFWERFSDLNGLLALTLCGAMWGQTQLAQRVLAAGVLGVWTVMAVCIRWRGVAERLVRLLPGQRLKQFAWSILGHLTGRFNRRFLLQLCIYTVAVIGINFGITVIVLGWIGGLPLSLPQLVAVFTISQLGLAVPSSPGSIGVYEASLVLPMVGFGIDRNTALALAVVLHAVQYAPATLGCVGILAGGGVSLRELRRQADLREA